jgi:hypothetical protein
MMKAAVTSDTSEKLIKSLHGATTQKTAIFVLTTVRTSNPTLMMMMMMMIIIIIIIIIIVL